MDQTINDQFWLFNGFDYQTKSDDEWCWFKEEDDYSLMVTERERDAGLNTKKVYHFQLFDANNKLVVSNAIAATDDLLGIFIRGSLTTFSNLMDGMDSPDMNNLN